MDQKHELKIYKFSIDIFSFVKSLNENNIINIELNKLLQTANNLYNYFLETDIDKLEIQKSYMNKCTEQANICFDILQKMEVPETFLNEKVDLNIEIVEIKKILNKI